MSRFAVAFTSATDAIQGVGPCVFSPLPQSAGHHRTSASAIPGCRSLRSQPEINFCRHRQDDKHGFRMDRGRHSRWRPLSRMRTTRVCVRRARFSDLGCRDMASRCRRTRTGADPGPARNAAVTCMDWRNAANPKADRDARGGDLHRLDPVLDEGLSVLIMFSWTETSACATTPMWSYGSPVGIAPGSGGIGSPCWPSDSAPRRFWSMCWRRSLQLVCGPRRSILAGAAKLIFPIW